MYVYSIDSINDKLSDLYKMLYVGYIQYILSFI